MTNKQRMDKNPFLAFALMVIVAMVIGAMVYVGYLTGTDVGYNRAMNETPETPVSMSTETPVQTPYNIGDICKRYSGYEVTIRDRHSKDGEWVYDVEYEGGDYINGLPHYLIGTCRSSEVK